jgi:hypothetical protein
VGADEDVDGAVNGDCVRPVFFDADLVEPEVSDEIKSIALDAAAIKGNITILPTRRAWHGPNSPRNDGANVVP